MTCSEEIHPRQECHKWLGKDEDNQQIYEGRESKCKGKSLNSSNSKYIEQSCCNNRDCISDSDRVARLYPATLNGRTQRATLADLISDALEIDDE